MVRSIAVVLCGCASIGQVSALSPALTPAPNGPYRVVGNRILDRHNRPYLIRGTRLAPLAVDTDDANGSAATAFGPLSATTLITIRQRLNMNAVRAPISAAEYTRNAEYRARVERLVRLANQLELLVILEAREEANGDLNAFWASVATIFRESPNVFFAPLLPRLVRAIRETGAHQPVIISRLGVSPEDTGVIYQITPHYAALRTDRDRRQRLGTVAVSVPLLVDGLDPEFGRSSEDCAAFPGNPTEATALVQANLAYFDAAQVSWTASSFTPGKLITDYRYFNGTKLDPGWTCGEPPEAGLGMVLLSHLWNATPLGLFTVSESRGGIALARGGISTMYGPIFADEDMQALESPLPTRLGNVSIRITDSRGAVRFAPLLHTQAGWAFLSFVVPDECAIGPAEVAVVRTDGSETECRVLIADLAPAIFSVPPDGRSIAFGQVTQHIDGKPDESFPVWQCDGGKCWGSSIALSSGVMTTIRLLGTGFRHAGEHPDVRATVGGVAVPVLSIGPSAEPGADQLTVELPDALRGAGETDLFFTVNGELSNVVRINCGSGR